MLTHLVGLHVCLVVRDGLLLGLLRGGDSVAVGMLGALGVDAAELRRAVEQRRRRSA